MKFSRDYMLGVMRHYTKRKLLQMMALVLCFIIVFHGWLHITNPYADISIVQQPYATYVENGKIKLRKNYEMNVRSNVGAQALGYYKSGFLIAQNTFRPLTFDSGKSVEQVFSEIHQLRFDPSKPYLISGNQFSVLYPRNLGVFYSSLLNPLMAHSQSDWENRQRIYLQSTMYALDAFSSDNMLTTTIVPMSQRGVALTQVHPGSVPSDSLYGILYALDKLAQPQNLHAQYKIQTTEVAKEVIEKRQIDLRRLVDIYLQQVQDPQTGLVKRHIHLASARDGVTRDSSFYDNVILWKTLQLAHALKIYNYPESYLTDLREAIINEYWDEHAGIFSDEFREENVPAEFSSDWLIALPTGFLNINNRQDLAKLARVVTYTENSNLAKPLPIKYTLTNTRDQAPAAVKWFVPNYGGDAIWSYWGAEYLTLLSNLYDVTKDGQYYHAAERGIAAYDERIKQYGGFPETFKPDGTFLEAPFYRSILETGWVVQYELARQQRRQNRL